MLDLKLDDSWDIYVDGDDLALVAGVDEVVQKVKIALQLFREEYLFDTDAGVPYFQDILTHSPNISIVEAVIRREILAVEEIEAILTFSTSLNRATRQLTVTFSASSTEGIVEVSEVFP